MARMVDLENAMDIATLYDWYITSVSQDDEPVWTEKHIDELFNDFYVIPKETQILEPERPRMFSVTENPPPKGEDVIALYRDEGEEFFFIGKYVNMFSEEFWRSHTMMDYAKEKVTHWTPMPGLPIRKDGE